MPDRHEFKIRLALERALNREVPDDFIRSYSDFVKWRELLPHMKYNKHVFQYLAMLTSDLWNSTKKVNRYQLLRCMARYNSNNASKHHLEYYGHSQNPTLDLLAESDELIFNLALSIMISDKLPATESQFSDFKMYANRLLMRVKLNDNRVEQLIFGLSKEQKLVNRLLRYKETQPAISNWARNELIKPNWVYRRGEIIAWVINEDPDFEISDDLLWADFSEMNRRDMATVERYLHNIREEQRQKLEFPELFEDDIRDENNFESIEVKSNILRNNKDPFYSVFPGRPGFIMPRKLSAELKMEIPDTKKGIELFKNKLPVVKSNLMLRAILHCHLTAASMFDLFIKYYHPENDYLAINVAIKTNNIKMLKWLLTNR